MTASTCGPLYDYDTKISVYCKDCEEPICVGGNDDNCSGGASTLLSTVSWCSQFGAEYLILVHGFGGASGNFTLFISDNGERCKAAVVCIPEGACCRCDDDQFCTIETGAGCDALGGNYLGDNTECEAEPFLIVDSSPNIPIPDNDALGASDTINVGDSFTILDLNVDLTIDHTWVGDLCVTLSKDGGPSVELIVRPGFDGPCGLGGCCGCAADNYDGIILSDEGGGGAIEDMCQNDLTSPLNYTPNNPLSFFDGMDSAGAWTLTVIDGLGAFTGTLVSWSLHFSDPGASPCAEAFPDQCPGACCFADGTCQDLTGADCGSAGGIYQGDATDCQGVTCRQPGPPPIKRPLPTPVPILSPYGGFLFVLVLAVLGMGMIRLRRRKR